MASAATPAPIPTAGPSTTRQPSRKPKRPRPSSPAGPSTSITALPAKRRKLPPPLPPRLASSSHPQTASNGKTPSLPIKVLQGQGTRRTDSIRPGYGREVVFVTRKVSLGALMGRCKSLVVSEGYSRLTLYAMTAAIPHALLLLHALLDLLPYPKGPKGMWYEIHTGSTECVDEVQAFKAEAAGREIGAGNKGVGQEIEADNNDEDAEFRGIGGVEENEPERKTRIKSTIRIDLHISPRPKPKTDDSKPIKDKPAATTQKDPAKRNRPSKKQREALARQRKAEKDGDKALRAQRPRGPKGPRGSGDYDEEEMMNSVTPGKEVDGDEEEEAVEEVEER